MVLQIFFVLRDSGIEIASAVQSSCVPQRVCRGGERLRGGGSGYRGRAGRRLQKTGAGEQPENQANPMGATHARYSGPGGVEESRRVACAILSYQPTLGQAENLHLVGNDKAHGQPYNKGPGVPSQEPACGVSP